MDEKVIEDTLREAWLDFKQRVGIELKEEYFVDDSYVSSFKETFITGNPMAPIRTTLRVKTSSNLETQPVRDMVSISFRLIQQAFQRLSNSSIQRVDDKIYMQFKELLEGFLSKGEFVFRESKIGGHDFKVVFEMKEEAGVGIGAGLSIEFSSSRGVWGYDNKPKERVEPSSPMLGPHRPPLVSREDWKKYLKENNLDITGSFFATADTKLDALQALEVFKPQLENPDSRLRQRIMSILRT